MDLAEKMVRYRAEKRISQKRLAELVGINYNSIYKIEKGGKYRTATERKILNVIEKE